MFCIQIFLFEYDIITSYLKDFSALKCTALVELFYVTIYTQMFTIWFNGKWSNSYQFSVTYIQKLFKKYYNNGPLNA